MNRKLEVKKMTGDEILFAVQKWVQENKERLLAGRGTTNELRAEVSDALGHKVSAGKLNSALRNEGMSTRKTPQADKETQALKLYITELEEERDEAVQLVTTAMASKMLPQELVDILFKGATERMRALVFSDRV